MTLVEFVVFAFSSIFVIVDPIATVPAFLAMTPADTREQRLRMARLACFVTAGILVAFAFAGTYIFRFLGITLASFRMAGSIILLLIALDMLRAQRSRVQETPEETDAGLAKTDIAITPLAVPMLAGPGAISTVILLHGRAQGWPQHLALLLCIGAVALVTYVIFAVSARGAKWLSPIVLRLTTRLMGLLLAAIAMQFLIDALRELKLVKG
jgi:multiple antibiotic resistance protein